jgi:uncharacterized protein (DUF2141 family)
MMNLRFKSLMFAMIGAVLLVSGGGSLSAQTPEKCTLTVKVTGIHDTDGNVKVTLRSGPDTVVQSQTVDIDSKTMTATAVFQNLPAGDYGVAALHDENKNGKLDFNEMGMPVEGYGHSNNPSKRMGAPGFDETKFTLNKPDTSIEIELIYWP